ncbi:MAG: CocE/NonD family hydrolase [Isosphaeraceae bacterium]
MSRPAIVPLARRARWSVAVLTLCVLVLPVRSGAQVFTASDFARLAEGVEPGRSGELIVSAWSAAGQDWTLSQDGDTATLRVAGGSGSNAVPRWQKLGSVKVQSGQRLRIVVPPGEKPKAEAADPKAAKPQKDAEKKSDPPAVPALLVLSEEKEFDPDRLLELVRGRVDTVEPTPDRRRVEIRTNQQGADFQPPASAAAWRDRAEHLRQQMLVSLGLWPTPPKTPLNPQIYGKLDRDGYTIEKVVLETLPGFTLSGNLYRPARSSGKIPGILCPHGHWSDGRVNPEVQQRCIRWAKLGAVVFMYDMVGYNDSKPFTHAFLNDRLRRWGYSLAGLQTWNSIRALDWLTSLPDVDQARIGCTGESGGGTQTFLLTALDRRVKVAAPVVMVSDSFQGGCVCENAAGLRHGTDNVEFAALCAPRPMMLVGATGDWTAKTMTNAFPAIRGVYSLIGSTDRVEAAVFDFPHNYNQTSRNAVYAFMGRWLLGIEDSASTREGEQKPEKPEELWTFGKDHPAPNDRKTPEQLESDLIDRLRVQVGLLSPQGTRMLSGMATSEKSANWQPARKFLSVSHANRVGLVNPPPEELVAREVRRLAREGVTIVHSQLGRRQRGEAIPVVRLIPTRDSGRLTVLALPSGKAGLTTPDGRPSALAAALLARGQSVVGFDPLFVGESSDPLKPVAHRPETVHFETYNPSLAADQIQDLATVLAWARSQADVREVCLVGVGVSGVQVLLALPRLEGLARTAVDAQGVWPNDNPSAAIPPALDLPGLFQFGGPEMAIALAAPSPLWIARAPEQRTSWAADAYGLAGVPQALKVTAEAPSPEALARWIDRGE